MLTGFCFRAFAVCLAFHTHTSFASFALLRCRVVIFGGRFFGFVVFFISSALITPVHHFHFTSESIVGFMGFFLLLIFSSVSLNIFMHTRIYFSLIWKFFFLLFTFNVPKFLFNGLRSSSTKHTYTLALIESKGNAVEPRKLK